METKNNGLTLQQDLNLAQARILLEGTSSDQMKELYIELLEVYFLLINANKALMREVLGMGNMK